MAAALAALALVAPSPAEATDSYQPVELSFTGATHSNPYTDVSLVAEFEGPDGETVAVDGFWDGGTTWRVRFAPPTPGQWSYVTRAQGDSSLAGQSGALTVASSDAPGFIEPDPFHPHFFRRSRGEPVLPIGDTNWRAMSTVDGAFPRSAFESYVDIRVSQGFNFLRIYIVPIDDEGLPSNANEGGAAFEPWDPDHLNPAYFAAADQRLAYAVEQGLTPALLFGADRRNLTDFFGWDDGKLERYVRYCIARYGAYDVIWEGRTEFEDQGSETPDDITLANQLGAWMVDADPHDRARSIHTIDTNAELGDERWLGWIMHQGFPDNASGYGWDWITADRAFGKPVMNEEFFYEDSGGGKTHAHHTDADTVRRGAWHVMTAGAAGLAYANTGTYNARSQPFKSMEYIHSDGADYMGHLATFWQSTRWWRLSPPSATEAVDLVRAPGEEYVAYLPTGGTRAIWISAGNYRASWFNPRSGETEGAPTAVSSAGEELSFTAPDSQDWVLHVVRDLEPPTDATLLGPVVPVGLGYDPDVAVAADGTIHVVYVRANTTYYVRSDTDGDFTEEIEVATGVDPRIALGPDGTPHVAVCPSYAGGSTIQYARWEGTGFSDPVTVVGSGYNRKPRIAVDSLGNATVSWEDRTNPTDRVRFVQIAPDGTVSDVTIAGENDNGGLDVDVDRTVHLTYRADRAIWYTTSSGPGDVAEPVAIIEDVSDFSELEIDDATDTLHVVAERHWGGGILYASRVDGAWSEPELFAETEVVGVDDPDHVNPAVAAGALGRVYIVFAGRNRVPYYSVIDEQGHRSAPRLLAAGGGTTGGKFQNPLIEPLPGEGALVAWSSADHVYLRTIGVPLPEPPEGELGAGGAGSAAEPFAFPAHSPSSLPSATADDTGCSCTVGGRSQARPGWLALLLLLGLPLRRRLGGARDPSTTTGIGGYDCTGAEELAPSAPMGGARRLQRSRKPQRLGLPGWNHCLGSPGASCSPRRSPAEPACSVGAATAPPSWRWPARSSR
ncbi:MAG: DUF4038 domain-containing protein [Deltaproteobacteria bacterium]|nr:DUF4038 domain-containing protein [Deltaproteobacteria bacterium]MBW2533196.1 DUF4038 domain-containing protein [Deltaproteobacteria bacterium]